MSRKSGNSLFKDIGEIKGESVKGILKTPIIDEEEEDGKDFEEPKHRVAQSTPLSTRRSSRRKNGFKRKNNSRSGTGSNEKSKKIRSSAELNSCVELFSENESISIKDIEGIENNPLEVPLGDIDLAKTISFSSDVIGDKSELPSPGLTASMINKHFSGETPGKNIDNKDKENSCSNKQKHLSPCIISSSVLNQRLSNETFDGSEGTLTQVEKPNNNQTPSEGQLDKCLTETFYESVDDDVMRSGCAARLFNDSNFTKNESALMKLELTNVESSYNTYPQNTFYGLPPIVKEILIQTRGITKLYGELFNKN